MAITVAIEGYDSLEQIGIGGMAAVYRARKVSIDKIVAIKVLFPYLATDESYIERFQREAKAAASIQHENVVNVIDFGESDGAFYIVMEYYEGRTLEHLMKERPGLPPDVSLRILLEVAYGLEAAHALDIVHRDVKPANIIFTNQGGIKIADFGLARKSDSMTMITQHGKVVGTPAYMSPEQAAGRPVGPPSDIFSFGVVAYELLGRRKPFEGQSYSDVLEKIQTFDPACVATVNPLISPELDHLVKRCLEKDEHARYRHAGELVADLEAAMELNRVARDRRQLAAYAKDPGRYDSAFAEKTITECLSRGAYFMQKGRSHLDDAVLEYRRVLFLDPSHERAMANLGRLRAQKSDSARTQMMDAVLPNATPVPAARAARGGTGRRGDASHVRKPRARVITGMAAALLLLGAGAFWLVTHSREGNVVAQQTQPHAVLPAPASTASTIHDAASDSLPGKVASAAHVARDTIPAIMKASSSDDGLETSAATKPAPPATHRQEPAPKRDAATKPQPARVAAPGPVVENGALSVYFLGGVGDVWIDGKLFAQQPPFEKASIPAGVHRVSCRMSGDTESHELTVTIQPGRETVIEYETGGTPVVSNE